MTWYQARTRSTLVEKSIRRGRSAFTCSDGKALKPADVNTTSGPPCSSGMGMSPNTFRVFNHLIKSIRDQRQSTGRGPDPQAELTLAVAAGCQRKEGID